MSAKQATWLFAAALATNTPIDSNFKKFHDALNSQVDESKHFDDVFLKSPGDVRGRFVEADAVAAKLLARMPLRARLEWMLRDKDSWPRLQIEEIGRIPAADVGFLDDLLWAYLQGQTVDFFKVRVGSWPVLFSRIKVFVTTRNDLLEKGDHRAWWQWFANDEVEDPSADPRLRALNRYILALSARDSDHQIENLVEARYVVGSHPLSQPYAAAFEEEIAKNYFQNMSRERALAIVASISKVKTEYLYQQSKVALLDLLRKTLDARGIKDVGARAFEAQTLIASSLATQSENPRLLLELADYFARSNRPARALDNYLKAIAAKESLEAWELIEAYRGAGLSVISLSQEAREPDRTSLREWGAEYFRLALNSGLATPYRDDLLMNYAKTLSDLGQWKPSFEVYESLFTGASTKAARLKGLSLGLNSLLDGLNQSLSGKNKRIVLRRYLDLLVFYSRTPFEKDVLKKYTGEARDWAQRLELSKDDTVVATLNELDAKSNAGETSR